MPSHQYRGQASRRNRRRKGFSQASTRRGITLYDQHDREWTTQVGLKTGMPTGLLVPSFKAPWYPDQSFLVVNPDNTSELFINYAAMLNHRRARMDEFHTIAVDAARERNQPVPKRGEYAEELLRVIGKPPKPLEPVVAAMQNNSYILGPDYAAARGIPYRVDPRLERFVAQPATERILEEYDFRDISFADAKAATEAATAALGHDAPSNPVATEPAVPDPAHGEAGSENAEAALDKAEEEFGELAGAPEDGDVDAMLEDLEDEYDADASGGRTVRPENTDRFRKQAPRRPGQKMKPGKRPVSKADRQKARQRGNRRTLADGGSPVISDGGL